MRLFYLRTRHDAYYIHENGRIERTDMQFAPSDSWRMLGIQHVRLGRGNPNGFIPFEHLSEWLAKQEQDGTFSFLFKNGKPQWTVRDLDHGTVREWGNTEHHGISDLRRVAA